METKLSELVTRLKSSAGDNLKAVVLYGSGATSGFQAQHSDLNVMCVVERAALADLERLHAVTEWWMQQNNPAPVIFTRDELTHSADVFAIEQLEVPLRLHRLQGERELRTDWLRLRGAILAAPQKKKIHLGIMLSSVATFCVLFRHALIAL